MITFKEMGIQEKVLRALDDLGFENPMPVQENVVPVLLKEQKDLVCLAQTGTGKTAAFGLPLIERTDVDAHHVQALVLCPTRELCIQIAGDLNDFSKYIPELKVLPVYGGSSIENQIKALKKGVHIVVATPGRLVDLIKRKSMKLQLVTTVVLDEADEMLNMGFQEDINFILGQISGEHNTLLFSATMPDEVARIAKNYMNSPREIVTGSKNSGAENIKHVVFTVHARDKYLALKRIVDLYPSIYGIVFCRTRIETQEVADKLIQDGYNAESLHGDLSQAQRDAVMQKFRIRHVQLLVATDVAARGLDVNDLTHVINYNLPDDLDAYTHRSGRTGRAGKTGISIALINLKEKHLIRQIEKKINKSFVQAKIPGGREICEKQLFHLVDKMERVEMEHTEIDSYLPVIYKKLEWIEKEEIIKRFVALEFNRFLEYYKGAKDLNVHEDEKKGDYKKDDRKRDRSDRSDRGDRGDRNNRGDRYERGGDFTMMKINVGKEEGLRPKALMDMINEFTPGKKVPIGKIDLNRNFALFEVGSSFAKSLPGMLQDVQFNGVDVKISIDKKGTDEKPKERWFEGADRDRKKKKKNR
ncbi:MAG: DEAD/DEAH box helicase [Syntrophothermus sp.]